MGLTEPPHSSPYYPPRARWRKPLAVGAGQVRTRLHRWGVHVPTLPQVFNKFLQLLIPGLAFYFTGQRQIALCIGLCWTVGALVFFVWLGTLAAALGFVVMIAAHATSILRVAKPMLQLVGFSGGIPGLIAESALVLFLAAFVYQPVRHWLLAEVALPLRTGDGVVVVNPEREGLRPERGELVAFRIERAWTDGLAVRRGYAIGPVMALPGDKVSFEPGKLIVNGTAQRQLANMPVSGELTVPEKSWLIWPEIGIEVHGRAPDGVLSRQLVEIALVEQHRLVGRPYSWWFGRRQILNEQVRSTRVR